MGLVVKTLDTKGLIMTQTNAHVYAPIKGSKRDLAQEALDATRNAVQGTQSARKGKSKGLAFMVGMFVGGFKAKTSREACKRLMVHLGMVTSFVMFFVSPATLGVSMAVAVLMVPLILTWRLSAWKLRRNLRKNP